MRLKFPVIAAAVFMTGFLSSSATAGGHQGTPPLIEFGEVKTVHTDGPPPERRGSGTTEVPTAEGPNVVSIGRSAASVGVPGGAGGGGGAGAGGAGGGADGAAGAGGGNANGAGATPPPGPIFAEGTGNYIGKKDEGDTRFKLTGNTLEATHHIGKTGPNGETDTIQISRITGPNGSAVSLEQFAAQLRNLSGVYQIQGTRNGEPATITVSGLQGGGMTRQAGGASVQVGPGGNVGPT